MPNRSDDFNRADNAASAGSPSDGGAAWFTIGGGETWGISGNRLYNPSAHPNATLVLESTDVTSGYVQATIPVHHSKGGLIARATDFSNYYCLRANSGSGWVFQKRQSASWTVLFNHAGTNANGDVIRVAFSGNVFQVFVNGVQIGTNITDSFNNTATRHGIYASDESTTRWDDFSIVASSGSTAQGTTLSVAASIFGGSASGGVASGTFTSEVLKRNNGTVAASSALTYVRFYNISTGALVLTKTGLSTNGSGIFTTTDAALVNGTTYAIDWEESGGQRRMPRKAAT